MTTCRIVKEKEQACIELKGHAGYAKHGYDIVCASITTACVITANLIEKLDLSYNVIDLVCDEGYFRLKVNTVDKILNGIFENLEFTMEDISKQYPKYLKIVK
jgi:uncharacterized protein YsxB (DUF464 family)